MKINGTYQRLESLLAEYGELSETAIAESLGIPSGNVRAMLISRNCFGQNEQTGRWGLREHQERKENYHGLGSD